MFVLPLNYPLPRRAFHPGWSRTLQRVIEDTADTTQRPAMDVAETDRGYTLSFDLPGMAKEQVKVSIDGRTVSVEASPVDEAVAEAPRLIYRERRVPRFARSVTLPTAVDHAGSQARFENGVLTLTLVKRLPEGAKTLTIQ